MEINAQEKADLTALQSDNLILIYETCGREGTSLHHLMYLKEDCANKFYWFTGWVADEFNKTFLLDLTTCSKYNTVQPPYFCIFDRKYRVGAPQ